MKNNDLKSLNEQLFIDFVSGKIRAYVFAFEGIVVRRNDGTVLELNMYSTDLIEEYNKIYNYE